MDTITIDCLKENTIFHGYIMETNFRHRKTRVKESSYENLFTALSRITDYVDSVLLALAWNYQFEINTRLIYAATMYFDPYQENGLWRVSDYKIAVVQRFEKIITELDIYTTRAKW